MCKVEWETYLYQFRCIRFINRHANNQRNQISNKKKHIFHSQLRSFMFCRHDSLCNPEISYLTENIYVYMLALMTYDLWHRGHCVIKKSMIQIISKLGLMIIYYALIIPDISYCTESIYDLCKSRETSVSLAISVLHSK